MARVVALNSRDGSEVWASTIATEDTTPIEAPDDPRVARAVRGSRALRSVWSARGALLHVFQNETGEPVELLLEPDAGSCPWPARAITPGASGFAVRRIDMAKRLAALEAKRKAEQARERASPVLVQMRADELRLARLEQDRKADELKA